jgi:drug/metabolite transporter (DMT)-like permease
VELVNKAILAYQHATASQIAPFNYSVVIFSGLIGWVVWHTSLDWLSVLGIALVCAGGILSIVLAPAARHSHGMMPAHGYSHAADAQDPQ